MFYCYKMTTLKCPARYIFVLFQFEDPVLIKFITKNLLLLVFISVLELIFFNSLFEFSANNLFMHIVLQTIYLVFSGPANIFFNIFHPFPLQKNNGSPLYMESPRDLAILEASPLNSCSKHLQQ